MSIVRVAPAIVAAALFGGALWSQSALATGPDNYGCVMIRSADRARLEWSWDNLEGGGTEIWYRVGTREYRGAYPRWSMRREATDKIVWTPDNSPGWSIVIDIKSGFRDGGPAKQMHNGRIISTGTCQWDKPSVD